MMSFKDFMYAVRTLRHSPVFTMTAVATLALGIGASTAIFSVTNSVLLKPLPYKDPARLVVAVSDMRKRNVKDFPFSNADFFDLRNGTSRVFENLEAVFTFRGSLPKQDGTPEEVQFGNVTPNFFQMLGVPVVIGRNFTATDAVPQTPTAPGSANPARLPNVAILSYEYFQHRYNGDPSILGRPIATAGGGGPLVVGVLARDFELLLAPSAQVDSKPDIWIAARLEYDNKNRNSVAAHLIGRLRAGVTLEQAQSQADLVAAELRRNFTIRNTAGFVIRLEPMQRYLVAHVRPAILALMGSAIFLLLIACANVANLMLVRMSLRQRELAVRASLGASMARLVKQTLIESGLLALLGTVLGVMLAWLGIHQLLSVAPHNLPRLDAIRLDPLVLAFSALIGLGAAALFGIVPAVRTSRPDVMSILRGSSRTAGLAGGGFLRNTVVVAEVALCFVLLVGSGLMFRSFLALQQIDPGFDPRQLLTFELLGPLGSNPQERAAAKHLIHDRLASLPGVQAVTAGSPFPLTGNFSPIRWGNADALADPSKFQAVDFQLVLPGYLNVLRSPLLAGRTFTEADNEHDRNVVLVDQFLAAKVSPFESAVGKEILIRLRTPEPEWVEIIGVVAHQRAESLAEAGREQIFFTDGFLNHSVASHWALRTVSDPASYATAVRKQLADINPRFLITQLEPMSVTVGRAQSSTRFSLLLIGVFAGMGTLLASIGLYGVLSTVVRQRTAEIGVRMALGATPSSVFGLVVGKGLQLSAIGIIIGITAAAALTRLIASLLVGIKATDPITFAAMIVLFLAIAAVASWLPARRASALDPAKALHQE